MVFTPYGLRLTFDSDRLGVHTSLGTQASVDPPREVVAIFIPLPANEKPEMSGADRFPWPEQQPDVLENLEGRGGSGERRKNVKVGVLFQWVLPRKEFSDDAVE
jgi:hypothetical protein